MKYFSLIFLFFAFTNNASRMYETLDFDQVRAWGGFSAQELQKVTSIIPSDQPLSEQEVKDLSTSPSLGNLRILNLRDQKYVNDYFVQSFCDNTTFSRIIDLNLSGTNITSRSFNYILESPHLGSIRDLPQVSGRFGIPISRIYIRVEEIPELSKKEMNEFNREKIFKENFTIEYLHPIKGTETCSPGKAVKVLEIKDY